MKKKWLSKRNMIVAGVLVACLVGGVIFTYIPKEESLPETQEVPDEVEMREARYRALTRGFFLLFSLFFLVEMREARYRALTRTESPSC